MIERDDEATVQVLLEAAGSRPELPREDLDGVVAAARSEWQERWGREEPRRGAPSGRRWIAAAALLAVAVGLAWWWQTARGAGEPPAVVARVEAITGLVQVVADEAAPQELSAGESVSAGEVLVTEGGGFGPRGRVSLRLATGTTLRVAGESRVRLASADVLVLAHGAVYLDTGTAEAGAGGVEVRTPLGTARDVGTQFTVRAVGGEEGTVRVQVREGAVEVTRGETTYRARRGDELVLRSYRPVERREISPHGRHWEWVIAAAPRFELEGRTLRELLHWVSRETGWRILYEDEALEESAEEIVLHGSLGEVRADQAAFTVLPGAGLEGELGGGVLLVRRGDSR